MKRDTDVHMRKFVETLERSKYVGGFPTEKEAKSYVASFIEKLSTEAMQRGDHSGLFPWANANMIYDFIKFAIIFLTYFFLSPTVIYSTSARLCGHWLIINAFLIAVFWKYSPTCRGGSQDEVILAIVDTTLMVLVCGIISAIAAFISFYSAPDNAIANVYVTPNVYSLEDTMVIIRVAEAEARRRGGWDLRRHQYYPTTDLAVYKINQTISWNRQGVDAQSTSHSNWNITTFNRIVKGEEHDLDTMDFVDWINSTIASRVLPRLARFYNVDEASMRMRDLFVVKYDADVVGAQRRLSVHKDSSLLSFNIALSHAGAFEGDQEGDHEGDQEEHEVEDGEDASRSFRKARHVNSGAAANTGALATHPVELPIRKTALVLKSDFKKSGLDGFDKGTSVRSGSDAGVSSGAFAKAIDGAHNGDTNRSRGDEVTSAARVTAIGSVSVHVDVPVFRNLEHFHGGGTHFVMAQRVVHMERGGLLTHPSRVFHAGAATTRGRRYIMVGFVDVDVSDWNMKWRTWGDMATCTHFHEVCEGCNHDGAESRSSAPHVDPPSWPWPWPRLSWMATAPPGSAHHTPSPSPLPPSPPSPLIVCTPMAWVVAYTLWFSANNICDRLMKWPGVKWRIFAIVMLLCVVAVYFLKDVLHDLVTVTGSRSGEGVGVGKEEVNDKRKFK